MADADVIVSNEGSVFLFQPMTDAAREWIADNVQDDAQFFGASLVVDHRYARDIADGMIGGGLAVA